ncbi:unnamed protein product [Zymoseptoria tritici ST99CH_1E4]|uniref:Uncharacterized protein n=1 Tax=Zymoseptoria tritici ST99CH_1E4 TaxID=1276532 RepID=A0A2H1GZ44_ZYMTR|nr:unnamed protein product [Zymoseptoria tritici ST99CH_1E4]
MMPLRLNCKVVIVSQSNVGVSALFQQVTTLIEQKPELQDLRAHCLRFRSHKVETHDVERMLGYAEIEDNAPPPDQYSMTAATHHFVQLNPKHELSVRLHKLLAYRQNGSKPPKGSPSTIEETVKSIQVRVFETLLCVSATMAMSTFLKDIGFNADAAIMDEASQATEADVLMTLTNQELLQLLLIVGDIQQLGPVVQSASARRNTHGNFLTTSALARFIKCHPHADHLKLMTNFRADPSLVPMPSELSYGGKIISGRPSNRGPLTQRVLRLSQGREFAGATKSRRPLLATSRQVFFDTKSNSHQDPRTRSTINASGVRLLVEFGGRLVNEAYVQQKDIGIISMYKMDVLDIA